MIGYYVHHVGRGHLNRARAIAQQLPGPVTGLSSLGRPAGWPGEWLQLDRDDDEPIEDPTAGGRLHWAPLRQPGLQQRMAAITGWLAAARPDVMVVDLSVEVTMICRLLGVPVVTTVLPGRRDDSVHQLGYDLSAVILAPWPRLDDQQCTGLDRHAAKVVHIGGLSRFDERPAVQPGEPNESGERHLVALSGAGGGESSARQVALPPGWRLTRLDSEHWVDDPWDILCSADVVLAHAGLGALADIAAARRPLICRPQARPHEEQVCTARALDRAGLAVVLEQDPLDWQPALTAALRLDPSRWGQWSSGDAAARAAKVIAGVAS